MVEGTVEDKPFRCVFRNVDTGSDDDIRPEAAEILRTVILNGPDGILMVVEYRH